MSYGRRMDELVLERTYPVGRDEIWRRWTTADGIESWWAPDGFAVEVSALELRPGGELHYAMIATGAPQIEFMQQHGMPLRTESRKTFTEVEPERRLRYLSLVDYAGVEPYEQDTLVELTPTEDGGTHVVMTMEPMHDDEWTQRLVAGRTNELDNLERQLAPN
jgi:uncharacterized protein YndB with AHSA1/START domain